MYRFAFAAALFIVPAACLAQVPTSVPPRYVDAIDWPSHEAGLENFALAEEMLALSFDRLCNDTFCEGPYGNLRPMQLSCSVDAAKGTLKQCLWIFAGSATSVNAATGAVQVSARIFKCKLQLARNTPVASFYDVMQGGELLNEKLPMTRRTVYENLVGCLP
jgi:hypothetical protein